MPHKFSTKNSIMPKNHLIVPKVVKVRTNMHSWASAGIGIPASRISVRYRTKKMPDCVFLVRYRTYSGIVSFFQSGTGLTGCQTVRHSGISKYVYMDLDIVMKHWHRMQHWHGMQHWHEHATWTWQAVWTWTCSMDMDNDMQPGQGHAAWTWTCSMDMDIQHGHGHGFGHAAWTWTVDMQDAWMPECR